MKLKPGTYFLHTRWLNDDGEPMRGKITQITKDTVHWRVHHGWRKNKSGRLNEYLGAFYEFKIKDADKYVANLTFAYPKFVRQKSK